MSSPWPLFTVFFLLEFAFLATLALLWLRSGKKNRNAQLRQKTRQDRTAERMIRDFPSIIAQIDCLQICQFANEGFEKWIGATQSQIQGQGLKQVIGAKAYERFKPALDRSCRGERVLMITDVNLPSGSQSFVEAHFIPKEMNGHFIGTLLFLLDKTNEHQQEERLRSLMEDSQRDRAQLTAVFDAVSDGIVVTDMAGKFIFVNEAEAKTNGYPNVDSMKRDLAYFASIYELQTMDGHTLSVDEWPLSKVLRGKSVNNWDLRARRKDTQQEWYLSYSGEPVRDAKGKQILAVIVNRDITEQRQREQRQIESLEQFKTMANSIPHLAWMAEPTGEISWYNDEWYKYTGQTRRRIEPAGWRAVHDPTVLPLVEDRWKQSLRTGQGFEMEFPMKAADGSFRLFLTRIRAIRDCQGHILRWFGTSTDIEELRKTREMLVLAKEQAEAANEAKSRFLANMSHELRTPMTAVLGFTEILKDSQLPEEEKQSALRRIDRNGRALLRLIDDILDISKIEAGKLKMQKVPFSPWETLTEVVSLFQTQAEQKGSHIHFHLDNSVPRIACSDPVRIRQILTNVIGNAVKFTSSGEIAISARAESDPSQKKQYLIFQVTDTGIGMSPQDQEKIFHPFAQADESITRQFGGTGLGLILSKRLCQELGGELSLLQSSLGKGSTFEVRLQAGPFEYHTQQKPSLSARQNRLAATDSERRLENKEILLVEDVRDNQILMRKYLQDAGANVVLAEDGEQAIQKATHHRFDVVLMDIQLPHVDGLNVTRQLRAQGFDRPILALTAHAMAEDAKRSLDAGCDEHLTKPISKKGLVETVAKWADGKVHLFHSPQFV